VKTHPIACGEIVSPFASFGSRGDDADDVICHLNDVSLFDQVQEDAFERGLAKMLANFAGGSLGDDLSFA
jgi:hypothetical protein